MVPYYGDILAGSVIRLAWNSFNSSGASVTRATNGTVSVYKDSGTTQSTTGVTDTEDFDSLTGVHWVAIDTSADGTFYSAGSNFTIVLSAATIDGQTVNAAIGAFSIENRLTTPTSVAAAVTNHASFTGLETDIASVLSVLGQTYIRLGTAQAGGASTITLDSSASATNDLYNGNFIALVSGTGAGQTRFITDYVGSSKVATVGEAWVTQPSSDTVFVIR